MNSVTILVTAGVATFIASDRLRSACPDRRLRLALAIGFVLMPAAQDLSWHLVYLQWSLAFFLLIRVLADEPGPRWIWPDRAAVAIAALTGPFSILFAPLYLWRRRRLGVTAWIVVACAVVQLFVVITAYRGPAGQTTPLEAVAVLATRLFVEPLLGYRVTWILSGAGIPLIAGAAFVALVLGLLVIASSVIPRRTLAVLVYAARGRRRGRRAPVGRLGGEPAGRLGRRSLLHVRHRDDHRHRHRGADHRQGTTEGGGHRARRAAHRRRRCGTSRSPRLPPGLGPAERVHRWRRAHAWSRSSPAATGTCAGRVASRATRTRRRGPADDARRRPAALSAPCSRTGGAAGSTRGAAGRR